jgi:hypothetical protein
MSAAFKDSTSQIRSKANGHSRSSLLNQRSTSRKRRFTTPRAWHFV